MDNFRLLDGLAGFVVTIMGWFVKETHQNHKDMAKDLADYKVKVAEQYTPNDRFEVTVKAIADDIKYIREKLDAK